MKTNGPSSVLASFTLSLFRTAISNCVTLSVVASNFKFTSCRSNTEASNSFLRALLALDDDVVIS